MNRHRLKSVQLTQFYLHRIKKLNPLLNAVITVSPTALADARAADKARKRGVRPAAARASPCIVKDNVDTTGMPTTAGSWALAGSSPATPSSSSGCAPPAPSSSARPTCPSGRTSARRRRRAAGAASAARPTWPTCSTATPAARAPASGVGASADLATVGRRHGDRRLDRLPVGRQRRRRHQADPRPPEPGRHRADLGRPGHRRPDHAQRDRRRRAARRDDRHRRQRSGDGRPGRPRLHRLHASSSTPHALEGARIGVWREGTYSTRPPTPESTRSWTDASPTLEAQGATIVDPADIHLETAYRPEFPALLCEFKNDIATLSRDVHRPRLPEDARRTSSTSTTPTPTSRDRGTPWNDALFEAAEATGGRRPRVRRRREPSRRRAPRRRSTTPWPPTTSTRSSRRPTARPGSPTRSTATSAGLLAVRRFVGPVGGLRLPGRHGAGGLSSGRCRSASRSSAAAGTSPS